MLKLSKVNVDAVPAMPAFYQKPKGMDDLLDFSIGKVLTCLELNISYLKDGTLAVLN